MSFADIEVCRWGEHCSANQICRLERLSSSLCRAECSSHGGTLASIHSREENSFLSSLVRPHGQFGSLTFIGATKVKENSTAFEWDDGTAWDFENWEPGRIISFLLNLK